MSELRRRGRASVLDQFRGCFGVESEAEIAGKAGCSEANVYMYARRHRLPRLGKPAPAGESGSPAGKPQRKGRTSVLGAWGYLLGRISDAEVARLADCTAANVSLYRKKKGIGSATPETKAAFVAAVQQIPREEATESQA